MVAFCVFQADKNIFSYIIAFNNVHIQEGNYEIV